MNDSEVVYHIWHAAFFGSLDVFLVSLQRIQAFNGRLTAVVLLV